MVSLCHVASDLRCKRCGQTIQRSFAKRFQAQAQVMMQLLFLATVLSWLLLLASLHRHAASRLCSATPLLRLLPFVITRDLQQLRALILAR
jgi:hypothetical protein